MMLGDLEVIKALLKKQAQKTISSILSSEDDLKDFVLAPSSENARLINTVFAAYNPLDYLVDLIKGNTMHFIKAAMVTMGTIFNGIYVLA